MDLLAAPDKPEPTTIEAHRIHDLVEYARGVYDVVILDLPAAYERVSQVALGESDKIFLVSGAELPALHLTRKLIAYLEQMQIGRERMSLIVNRIRGRQGLGTEDMEKVFAFPSAPCCRRITVLCIARKLRESRCRGTATWGAL